jgi:diguanylate cyclase (GGDEF)-like protein
MASLLEHIIKLTDHRERDLLELTLAKALIDLLPLQRVVLSRVFTEGGEERWLEVTTLDAKGGGRVVDPLRVNFAELALLKDHKERLECLRTGQPKETAWAGEAGPRLTYFPLLEAADQEQAVLEIHSPQPLNTEALSTIATLRHVFRNMYRLLAYSDRDGLTGLLNRKALDDAFYSAVLEELDEGAVDAGIAEDAKLPPEQERRHRVPPNYWLGTISVDNFDDISSKKGHLLGEEILLLVARIINNTFRTYDRLYRLGGDQYAVLLHCPEETLVLSAFERFRGNMDKFKFPQVGHLTACGGFTRIAPDDSPDSAIERAERAVQFARHQGGNRVVSYAALSRDGLVADAAQSGGVDIF